MIRFVVDRMPGKLAKWLRILGYDTFYDGHLPLEQLIERGAVEGRVPITRNSKIHDYPAVDQFLLLHSG